MKAYITKSKAGHYKVTIWVGNVKVYRSVPWSSIHAARADLARFKASLKEESA